MTEETTTPIFLILLKSAKTQLYPLQAHTCRLQQGKLIDGTAANVEFFDQFGDYLVWHCPLCHSSSLIQVSLVIQHTVNKESLLKRSILEIKDKIMFISFNEWCELGKITLNEETLTRMKEKY
jgi:hypothetical protein